MSAPSVRRFHGSDSATVRLLGRIDMTSIEALCDEIDAAVTYYRYPHVVLEIASPGGELTALAYYLVRLRAWQAQGLTLATLALTHVASAASILLSLGTPGHRRAHASSRLLFHNARLLAGGQSPWTAHELQLHATALQEVDQQVVAALVAHAHAAAQLRPGPVLEELDLPDAYRTLMAHDVPVDATRARELLLIDEVFGEDDPLCRIL
ncbi:MAG: hypothetical protein AMXMBFR53_09540 [Gemmatimonadota bacterium]